MERVLLADGVEDLKGKMLFKGLFGDDLVIFNDTIEDKPTVPVAFKLTEREHEALLGWAAKFKMSKSKFIRHCIRQQLGDLRMILTDNPKNYLSNVDF